MKFDKEYHEKLKLKTLEDDAQERVKKDQLEHAKVGTRWNRDGKYVYKSAANMLCTIISKYNDVIKEYEYLTARSKELQGMQNDLLHYIEFADLNIQDSYKTIKLLQSVRIERRLVKDELECMELAQKTVSGMKYNIEAMRTVQSQCLKKEHQYTKRTYYQRSSLELKNFDKKTEEYTDKLKEMVSTR